MKTLFTTTLALLILCSVAQWCSAQKITLTLEQAKELALKQNPTLAAAQANIEAAAAAVERSRSAFYPSLDLEAGATKIRDTQMSRPFGAYSSTTRYSVGLSASWLVYNGGARKLQLMISELGGDTAILECDDARRLLMENVALAFYVVMQAQNSMKIAKQDAEFNRQLHEEASKKEQIGVSKPSEVLNFEYQVDKAEVDYITAQRNWHNACIALGQLLAIPQECIWENIQLIPPDDKKISNYQIDLPKLLSYAAEHRPDLKSARLTMERAELNLQLAKSAWHPTISTFADYGYMRSGSARFSNNFDRGISFGVAASWNLFSGFNTQATIRQAEASVEYAAKAYESLKLNVDAEIRNNAVALESSRQILEKQNRLLQIATRIRDLVREEYAGGTTTITRLNEVQTDLTNTALAQSNAYVTVLNNLERLSSSTGYSLVQSKQPENTTQP